MPVSITQLKSTAPDIYWTAVDMAAAKIQSGPLKGQPKYSKKRIIGEVAWRVQAHNEKAALQGRPLVKLA
jgi:hypothetical protein